MTPFKLIAILSIGLFCLLSIGNQIYFSFIHAPRFESDLRIGEFVRSYRWSSLFSTLGFSMLGLGFCIWAWRDARILSNVGLWLFTAYSIYSLFLNNIGMYFREPLGDGSLTSAAAGWIKLHGNIIQISYASLLITSLFFGTMALLFQRKQAEP